MKRDHVVWIITVLYLGVCTCVNAAKNANREFVEHPFYFFDMQDNFSAAITLADVDNDGDMDILLANGRHWPQQNRIFYNNGSGRMLQSNALGNRLKASYLVLAEDIDRDGYVDILVVNDKLPTELFLSKKGDFKNQADLFIGPAGANARDAVMVDLNNDGLKELVVAQRGQPDVFYLQTQPGKFSEQKQLLLEATHSTGVAVNDVDFDGHTDLIFANRRGNSYILLNSPTMTFSKINLPVKGDKRDVTLTNANGDDYPDLVFAAQDGPNPILLGNESGKFQICNELSDANNVSSSVTSVDLNNDGLEDLVFGNADIPSAVYLQVGDCQYQSLTLDFVNADVYDVKTADLNNDSFPEIIFAISGEPNRIILNRAAKQ